MSNQVHKVFKIRHKETGLFSKGGSSARGIWTKGGKSWTNIGHVKSHLNHFINNGRYLKDFPYNDAEIIELEIKYEDCLTMPVTDLTDMMWFEKEKQEQKWKEYHEKWKEEREIELLEILMKKHPNLGVK